MLENGLAKPFLRTARENCYITPDGFSYSVLPRIAWGLMFELFIGYSDMYGTYFFMEWLR